MTGSRRIVARNHAVLLAVEIDVEKRGEEVTREDVQAQGLVIERDGQRGLVVTIDHGWHAASTTFCAGGPLAGLRTRGRLQFLDGRHCRVSLKLEK